MRFSEPFIRRPVGTSLLAAGVLLAGAIAFRFLPIAPLPQIEYPTIQVWTQLPGADPATMASAVSAPLERRFAEIAGVTELTSSSSLSRSFISIQFDLTRQIDGAARDVQAAIDAAAGDLPPDLPMPPHYWKSNPSDAPIIILALTSETIPPGEVYNFAVNIAAQQVSQIPGVGYVDVSGAERSAVRVQVDPGYLASLGIGLEDMRRFIEGTNANLPKGSLDGPYGFYALHVNDQLSCAADYAPLIALHDRLAGVRLSGLGRVVDGVENTLRAGWYGRVPATQLEISKQASANTIETVERIRAVLPVLRQWMPPGIRLDVAVDRTATIRGSVAHIETSLLLAVGLVLLVVFLSLRDLPATVIPACALPLTLAGTFGFMALAGFTVDNLSLMALVVGLCFIIDDAVIVIENTFRHLEAGRTPFEAARDGAAEIGPTIVSMSLSLCAVFVPMIFLGGVMGRLLHEFTFVLVAAILISGAISLSFTPMLCGRLLASGAAPPRGRLGERYAGALRVLLRHRRATIAGVLATVAATAALFVWIPKGLFPVQDTGNLQCMTEGAEDISFRAFCQKQRRIVDILLRDPAVDTVSSSIRNSANQGWIYLSLKPRSERPGVFQVIDRLRREASQVEGVGLFLQIVQDLRIGARLAKSTYQYTLVGADWRELGVWANALVRELRTRPHFQDVTTDLQPAGLEANLRVDRSTASRLGVSLSEVDNTLYDAFGQRQVSTMYEELEQRHVVLEASPRLQIDPSSLDRIFVRSSTGRMVPLGAMARVDFRNSTLVVNHQGQFPAATISFNLDPGYSLSDATEVIEDAASSLHFPSTIRGSFQGTARAFEDTVRALPWLILGSLLMVYVILGMLYESLIQPLTVLAILPSASLGALLALRLGGYDLDVVGLIGIVLLIGIVTKSAIIMIDFALGLERREGLSAEEAIIAACRLRFRPILMTMAAALLGALPLALRGGDGSELHRPLGVAILGGLLFSQALALFAIPVIYVTLDRLRRRIRPR